MNSRHRSKILFARLLRLSDVYRFLAYYLLLLWKALSLDQWIVTPVRRSGIRLLLCISTPSYIKEGPDDFGEIEEDRGNEQSRRCRDNFDAM